MKKSTQNDLTTGNPGSAILRFAIPILLTSLLQQFYSMLDTIIVGQFLGKTALAGVGSTGSINFMIVGFCMGLCYGFVIPIAQKFGARDYKTLRRIAANSFWVTLGISLVLTVIVCIFCRNILILMRTPDNILDEAYGYIFIIFAGIPITCAYNLLAGMIRSLGDSKTPLYFLMIASVINIGFDILSVTVLGMGVQGPALATLLAQAFSALLCFLFIRKRFPVLHIQKSEWKLESRYVSILCKMGIPMGLQYSITAIGSVLLQSGVNTLGSDSVAAVSAATKLHLFLGCPLEALGSGMSTYAGQNIGAGKTDRVGKGLSASVKAGMLYSAVVFLTMFFTSRYWMLLFIKPEETVVLSQASRFLTINCLFYFTLVIVNIFRYTIQGLGFSGFAVFSGIMEMIARTLIGVVLIPIFGFTSACFASPLAWIMADAFLIPAYFHVMRKISHLSKHPADKKRMC